MSDSDKVVIPIQPVLTDIEMGNFKSDNISKVINKQLSSIMKDAERTLKGIDPNKVLNTSLSKTIDSLTNAYMKSERALESSDNKMKTLGKTALTYRQALHKLENKLIEADDKVKELQRDIDKPKAETINQDSHGQYIETLKLNLAEAIKERDLIKRDIQNLNPDDYIQDASQSSVNGLVTTFHTLEDNVNKAKDALDKFKNAYTENYKSDSYNDLERNLEKIDTRTERIIAKSEKFGELGKLTSDKFKEICYDAGQLSNEISEIKENMSNMIESGEAFSIDPAQIDPNTIALNKEYDEQKDKLKEIRAQIIENNKDIKDTSGLEAQLTKLNQIKQTLENQHALTDQKFKAVQAKAIRQEAGQGKSRTDLGNKQRARNLEKTKEQLKDINSLWQEQYNELNSVNAKIEKIVAEIIKVRSAESKNENLTSSFNRGSARLKELKVAKEESASQAREDAKATLYAELYDIINGLIEKFDILRESAKKVKLSNKVIKSFEKLGKSVGKVANKISETIKKFSILNKFSKIFSKKTTGSFSKDFNKMSKNVMQFVFGFRSLYFMVKRLRDTFVDAFKAMAEQIPEVNADVSSFMTSINQLKGSLATAFQPIVSYIIPYLNRLMSALNSAMESVGRFFATLTGQGYIYKFVADQVDYAAEQAGDAADSTKDSVEEAEKSIMGFDEINRLDAPNKDSDNSSSGNDYDPTANAGGRYVQELLNGQNKLAQMIKDAWTTDADFTEVGAYIGEQLLNALTIADNWITKKGYKYANKLGKSFATLINGFVEVKGLANKIGKTIADALNMGVKFAYSFATNLHWKSIGQFFADWINSSIHSFDWEGLGKTVGELLRGIINTAWQFVNTVEFETLGEKISTAINNFLATMGNIDEDGLTGWQKLGQTISKWKTGILEMFIKALEGVEWEEVGQAIAELIGSIEWGQIAFDLGNLAWEIVKALGLAIAGCATTDPIAFGIAALFVVDKIMKAITSKGIFATLATKIFGKIGAAFAAKSVAKTAATTAATEAGKGVATAATSGATGTLASSAATIGAYSLLFFDAVMLAYDVSKLIEISNNYNEALESANSAIESTQNSATEAEKTFSENRTRYYKEGGENALREIYGFNGSLEEALADANNVLGDYDISLADAQSKITATYEEGGNAQVEKMQNVVDSVKSCAEENQKTVEEMPKNMFEGFAIEWSENGLSIGGLITTVFTNAIESCKDILGIHSPSTVFSDMAKNVVAGFSNGFTEKWENFKTNVSNLITKFSNMFSSITSNIAKIWTNVFSNIQTNTKIIFTNIGNLVKSGVNAVIGVINGMIRGIVSGINIVSKALNAISFKIPSWVPGFGGKSFKLNVPTISAPQIPYLAQGAVIPPNKEFMAVLGDQKRGTNIEAPLDTIKQAVAEELSEYIDAMMAGFNAVVSSIDNKDLSVNIGDENISQAVNRYNRKLAIIRGTI